MEYIRFDIVIRLLRSEVKNSSNAKEWIAGPNFKESLIELIEDCDDYDEDDANVIAKLELLDDLLDSLNNFEQEYKDLQVNKFKQLELLRHAARYVSSAQVVKTGIDSFEYDEGIETKECSHPPCGKVFVADPPSKMYCSEKCREKAKKWRKRHTNE